MKSASFVSRVVILVLLTAPAAFASPAKLPAACKVPSTLGVKPRLVLADLKNKTPGTGAKATDELLKTLSASVGVTRKSDLELVRANCVVENGDEARALAKAWKARVVVWGQLTGPGAPPTLFTTLGWSGRRTSGERGGLEIGLTDQFNLPTIDRGAQAKFALGVQFLDRPQVALEYFKAASTSLPIDPKVDLVPLYRAIGTSYLKSAGGPEQLLRIANSALSSASIKGTAAESELLTVTGVALSDQNQLDAAFYNLNAALTLDTKLSGSDSERVADDLDNLAGILSKQGDSENAAKTAERAIAIMTKLYGDRDPRVVGPKTRLGIILTESSAYAPGQEQLSAALAIDRGANVFWRIPDDLNNVGWNHAGQGQYDAAVKEYSEALKLAADYVPPGDTWNAMCQGNLAWALSGQGKQDEAIKLLRETSKTLELPDGSEDELLATQLEHLGSALIKQQNFAEARTVYTRAQSLNQRVFGSEHPTTLWVQRKYARSIAATSGWRQGVSAGAVVWRIRGGSPAAKLGLRIGDWIQEYGMPIKSPEHLLQLAALSPSGKRLTVLRDGNKVSMTSATGIEGAELYQLQQ